MQYNFQFPDELPLAVLSDDKKYRYLLRRAWGSGGKKVAFICLNPSTADALSDDQTVRKCIGFAKSWGGTELLIGNLFAYRSTDPSVLRTVDDPIGEHNDAWLEKIAMEADILVAGWGLHGSLHSRDLVVKERFAGKINALRLTNSGMPSHPLYLPGSSTPFPL
jgi:hypothetical protein